MNATRFLLTIPLLALTLACGSGATPDPTSKEALDVAPRFHWGSTCIEHDFSAYGSSVMNTETTLCLDEDTCDSYEDSSGEGFADDDEYDSDTYYSDIKYFEGTCGQPHERKAVSCADRKADGKCDECQYANCCAPVALCEDDPNCVAIDNCVNDCGTDDGCAKHCVEHGESTASQDWENASACIRSACAKSCE